MTSYRAAHVAEHEARAAAGNLAQLGPLLPECRACNSPEAIAYRRATRDPRCDYFLHTTGATIRCALAVDHEPAHVYPR